MTERENLPAKFTAPGLAATAEKHGSLVGRGLAAVQNGTILARTKDDDTLYRQARTTYNRIIFDNDEHYLSAILILPEQEDMFELRSTFEVFQQLADAGYGKAFFPLSLHIHKGMPEDRERARRYARLSFEWCSSNQSQNDPEIWNDLGTLHLSHRINGDEDTNFELAQHWYRKAADAGDATGAFNLYSTYELLGTQEEALYWQIKAAEYGNLVAILGLIRQCEFNGPDHEPDDEQALYWYRKAAEQGYPWTEADFGADRFFELGMRYQYGKDGTQIDDDKAREYFTEAAELNHAEAQYELFQLLDDEQDEQIKWLESSANLGFGPAQYAYYNYWKGFFEPSDDEYEEWKNAIEKAFAWYEVRAQAGDAQRQFEFAEIHLGGEALAANRAQGLHWLKASAAQDYIPACRRLGNEYLLSSEVSEHTTQQGIYWLTRVAELGDAWENTWAYRKLGDLYMLGHGGARQGRVPPRRIEPNKKAAIAWFERGIAMGDRGLAYHLGHHYLTGEHLDQDLQLAEKWLLHSAMAGWGSAQIALGWEYASGARLRQDVGAAIHWLELAAETNNHTGLKLAEIYLEGKIVPKNFEEAIKWLTHAVDSGARRNAAMKIVAEKCFDGRFNAAEESAAQAWLEQMAVRATETVADSNINIAAINARNLGELYELGLGVEKDMEKAIYWYRQSTEQGNPTAQVRLHELGIDLETT